MAEQSDIKLIASVEFAADTQSKLQRSLAQLERGLTLKSPIRNIVGDADSLTKTLDSVNNRVLTLGASFNALSIGGRIFKDVISSTIEVEKSLVEINSVFQLSTQNLDRFAKGLFDVSRETSQSFSVAAEAAKEFSRQGLGMQETLKRTKDALTLTRLAGIDATEAVNTLTASINGFHGAALDSTQITNKLATVDAAFAVSSRDLAQGLARAGAAASDAGVSFDELIGLITAAQQTTARGGAVIGNSLKTIFTRIERSNTIDAFEELGVKVRDVQGNTLSAMQILKNFAGAYDGLGSSVKKQAAELVGGVYQINVLKALLTDVSNQSGVFAQAQKISAGATEEATKRNEALNKSLDALLQRSATSAKQIASNLGSNSFLSPAKTILGGLNDNIITKSLEDASGKAETTGGKVAESFIKGLGNALFFGVTPVVATAFLNLSRKLGGRLFEFIKIESGLNTIAEQQKITQVAINQIYDRGGDALRRQLDSMTNLVQKATLYKALMASTALAERTRIEENKAIANILVTRPRLGKAGGYIPNAADGLASAIYSENQAISMGVGGAVPGSRAVVIPDFNFGGGKTGPIVANNSEFLVKNFANGGSAIFNRDMVGKYGLPSGAQPIAASGFVPNAAVGKISNPYSNPDYQRFLSGDISQSPEIKAQIDEAYRLLRNQNISKEAAFLEMEKEEKKRLLQNQKLNELGVKQISRYETSTITKAKETSLLLESIALKEKKNLLEKQAIQDDINIKVKKAYQEAFKETSYKPPHAVSDEAYQKWISTTVSKGSPDIAFGYFDRNKAYQRAMMGGSGGFGVDFDPAVEYALMSGTRKPSLWGRTKNYLSGENFGKAAFGASMIMPFVGGMLPSGTSGEFSGRSMGALSGALSGAGMGIAFGSMIAPGVGTAIGGIAGALVGGATGAIQKWNKSFEELAQEIQDANAKNGEQITNAANFIQIQQKIAEAISNGASPREVQSLINQQSTSLMRVSRAEDRSALARAAGDETALGKIFEQISYRAQKESISREFLSSVGRANEGRGTLGRLFGSNFDVKSIESMAEQLASTVNAPENKAAFEKFKKSSADNPAKAFKEMMLAIGVSSDDIEKELEILSKKPDDFKAVLHRFVEKSEAGIKEASLSAESINVTSRRVDLSKLYKDIGMQLSVYGQRSAAERLAGVEVSGARSRAAIEISSSGLEQLQKTNAEVLKAAQEELNINIEKSLIDGVAKIYDAASAYTTASGETPRTINAISEQLKNVKSEKDLLPIFESLGKSAESIRKVIENTYKDTAEMRAQGRIHIEKLSAIQRIDEIRARYEERNNILSGSRYSESGSAGFFQTVLGGRTRGISGKNPMAEQTSFLINEIEEISKLGISPTKEQRDILEQLKRRSAQSTYADILSTYTGKKVSEGGVDSAIKSLLEKPVNTLEDQVMQSNVRAIQIALKKLDETDTRKTVAALGGVTQESEAQKVEAARKALQGISGDGLAGAVANKTISLGEGRIVESLSPLSGIEKIAGDILKKMDEARMGGKDIINQQEARTNAILEEERLKNIENERIIRALENVNKDKLSEKFPIEYAEARRISEIGGFSPYSAGTLLSNTSNEMTKSGRINSLLRQEFASAKETPLETYQRLTTSMSEASRLAGGVEALKFILDELLGVYSSQKVNLSSSGTAYEVYQKQGIAARKLSNSGFSSPQLSDFSVESKTPFYKMGFTRPISIDKDTQKTLANEISSSIDSSDVGIILKEQAGLSKRAEYEKNLSVLLANRGTIGTQVSQAKMTEASRIGHEESDYMGSFTMGFQSHFNALRQDMYDLSKVGSRISSSIENSLGNAFGDFVTGAKSAKEAFRDFVTSVLADAARAFASKAVQQLIGASLGGLGLNFGGTSTTTAFAGGPIGFANGGKVPALLMGGEYVFSPQAAKSVGYDTLRSINRYAAGGTVVKGGSGVMDDVPAMLPAGSFVVRKSAVNRIGTGYLDSLASGGYVRRGLGTPSMTQFTSGEVGFTASYAGTPASTAAAAAPTGGSSFAGAAGGLAAGAVLLLASYLLGGGGGGSYKPKSAAEIAKYARELEASQNASLNSRPSGSNAFLISDGQGGYNYSGNVGEADVQRFADGGVAMNSAPITPTTSRNYGPAVGGISIAINNYGGQTTTSSKVSGGSGYEDQDFAQKLNRAVQEAVKQTLIEERRSGGMMQQFNRTAINSY